MGVPSEDSWLPQLQGEPQWLWGGQREGQFIKALAPFFPEKLGNNTIHMDPRGPYWRKECWICLLLLQERVWYSRQWRMRCMILKKICFCETGASFAFHGFFQCHVKRKKLIQLCIFKGFLQLFCHISLLSQFKKWKKGFREWRRWYRAAIATVHLEPATVKRGNSTRYITGLWNVSFY